MIRDGRPISAQRQHHGMCYLVEPLQQKREYISTYVTVAFACGSLRRVDNSGPRDTTFPEGSTAPFD